MIIHLRNHLTVFLRFALSWSDGTDFLGLHDQPRFPPAGFEPAYDLRNLFCGGGYITASVMYLYPKSRQNSVYQYFATGELSRFPSPAYDTGQRLNNKCWNDLNPAVGTMRGVTSILWLHPARLHTVHQTRVQAHTLSSFKGRVAGFRSYCHANL